MQKTLSEKIADFVLNMDYSRIPADVVSHGKLLIADALGVAMACRELESLELIRRVVLANDSAPVCTLWGSGDKVMPADAVLYNAALIHGADFDDTHVASIIHPSAAVVSTAITIGELVGADGCQMLEAIVAGWEVSVRLGLASRGRLHDVGYHGTGIVSCFAAACVAGKLMGCSAEALADALGICGSQAAAIQEFNQDGNWTKKIHPGWACHGAIYALNLAREGFTGSKKVFEGKFGVWMTHCGGTDGLEEEFSNLGTVWHTKEITVKLYPVCHMTHSFIDCMFKLMNENGFDAEDIDYAECRIEKKCYPIVCVPREEKIRPTTDNMMRFSLPYVLSVAAVTHRMGMAEIDVKYASDPGIIDLMERIECVEDDTKKNPGFFPGYVTVRLKDGRELVMDQRFETGTPMNPLNREAVGKKFVYNLSPFYSEKQTARISDVIENFEKLQNAEELIEAMIPNK